MANPVLKAVGFCAHYSEPGNWAFDYALKLSRAHSMRLNVFHFLKDPYDPEAEGPNGLSAGERARLAIQRERELRMYYDERSQDYLEVGFRLCQRDSGTELERCLIVREFQLLILAYPETNATFTGFPIESFANQFNSPVVLVGPDGPEQFRLNSKAVEVVDALSLPDGSWAGLDNN